MKANEDNYKVYVLKFPNNKFYVGMTKQSLAKRWARGAGYKNNLLMYQDIKKFGWDNIDKSEIYKGLSMEQAREKEMQLIDKYDSINYGYNSTKGGECGGTLAKTYILNGRKYNSKEISELSVKGISYHDITTRVDHHGWTLERAMSQAKQEKNFSVLYNGKYYTFEELRSLSKVPDLTAKEICCRINRGWSVDRAITQPKNVKLQPHGVGERIYEYEGNIYNSYELVQMSSVEGITISDITCRINHHGWSVEEAITKSKKGHNVIYEYNGKQYTSSELANLSPYNLAAHNITDRLRNGWSIENAINTPLRKFKSHTSQSITKAV